MKSHGLFAYMLFPLYKLLSLFCCLSICTWFTIAAGSWHHRRAPPPESVAMWEQQRALASFFMLLSLLTMSSLSGHAEATPGCLGSAACRIQPPCNTEEVQRKYEE